MNVFDSPPAVVVVDLFALSYSFKPTPPAASTDVPYSSASNSSSSFFSFSSSVAGSGAGGGDIFLAIFVTPPLPFDALRFLAFSSGSAYGSSSSSSSSSSSVPCFSFAGNIFKSPIFPFSFRSYPIKSESPTREPMKSRSLPTAAKPELKTAFPDFSTRMRLHLRPTLLPTEAAPPTVSKITVIN